jgi:multidrug efflux pump subunit AcrA (membrane-fusion protein)
LRDTSLTAPLAGVVLDKKIEPGVLVGPGSVAFVLGDVRTVKAVFGVPDTIVRGLAPGAALAMTSDALPGRAFEGRISSVSPAADQQSRVFGVEVTVGNADGALKPGMIATVQLDEAARRAGVRTEPVVTVPLAAIIKAPGAAAAPAPGDTSSTTARGGGGTVQDGGGYTVFVIEKASDREVARARAVTVGDVVGNAIEVSGGIRQGERVITTGATLVKDGDAVRVIP